MFKNYFKLYFKLYNYFTDYTSNYRYQSNYRRPQIKNMKSDFPPFTGEKRKIYNATAIKFTRAIYRFPN